MDVLGVYNFSLNLSTAECYLEGRLISKPTPKVGKTVEVHATGEHLLELTKAQKKKLDAFLAREMKEFEKLSGTTKLIEHKIKLKPGTEPIKQRYRPQNPKMQEIFNQEVDRMLAEGVIEPSKSPWSSPVVLVKKKDGKYR
ncbi:uncharacterized protein LOC123312308 [Coccinella septempunctata]|uniref:uncharacterized protein LOC123310587 n=1 Tax=Coccinella septempunctata TaxID=41139 RepID=UPI001D06E521|nr:uncharacterized protein LOC123310587 [Coccinella septempunctata]XP_044751218.1 uncharacterized protein LOC123311372 [Coccinella septempunctata]XP_044752609.1 uncharacterized protein LOC123312308 [Coccinella septempunctata]